MGCEIVLMDNENCYTVYMHTNKLNGMKYIGITSKDVDKRWVNGRGYRTGKFKNAIIKYGWENFNHEILKINLSEEEAKKLEIFYIKKLKTNNRNFGYNLTEGGDGTRGMQPCLGRKMSESEKTMRSKALMGHIISEETKRKIGEANKGKTTGMKGMRHSQKTIEKLKNTIQGRYIGSENPKAKKVINIKTMKIYGSAKELSQELNVAYSHFKLKLQGKYKNNTPYVYLENYKEGELCRK